MQAFFQLFGVSAGKLETLILVMLITSIKYVEGGICMVTYTVIITEAPYGKERPYTALRFARTCDIEGHKVKIFLIENGVYLAKKGQTPASDQPNLGAYLEDLISGGQEVKACVVCIQARGLSEQDLLPGVKAATIHELVEWTTNSDKVIVF